VLPNQKKKKKVLVLAVFSKRKQNKTKHNKLNIKII
jgi:hypothetical protein